MLDTTLTIEQIETLLVGFNKSPFNMRRNLAIPNCSWGFLNHEADLLVMSKARHLTEVEIKRSWHDFVADFDKKHSHFDEKLSHFYYCVPASIASKVFDWLYVGELKQTSHGFIPSIVGVTKNNKLCCGLIIYKDPDKYNKYGNISIAVISGTIGKYKCTQDDEIKLLRLLGMRVWGLKKKIASLQ